MIKIKNVSKAYGNFNALQNINLEINNGKIIGLLGRNGAGKTTLLRSIMGLHNFQGSIDIMGLNPKSQRAKLMENMSFISDVAVLPKWMKVHQVIDFVDGVHPKFNKEKALEFIDKTDLPLNKKIKALSKGMVTQLHLALITSIDVPLLILDEPTLGLDIITRKRFLDHLINDFFNEHRTIIITTHQVEEISSILTDLIIVEKGQIKFNKSMAQIKKDQKIKKLSLSDLFVKVIEDK